MFAINGFLKQLLNFGSSSEITLSTPGFWRPIAFINPDLQSAIRGNGLPYLGSLVVPLKEIDPKMLIS